MKAEITPLLSAVKNALAQMLSPKNIGNSIDSTSLYGKV